MDWMLFFVLISVVVIFIATFIMQKYLRPPEFVTREPLLTFSADLVFEPFPQTIDISNPDVCSGYDLKPCRLNDATSCIGCQNLISSCVHFDNDTEYIDYDGQKSIIPKNEDSNDGYCLSVVYTEDFCNLYHGDMALVQIEPASTDTMLICNCRNPGLIGNTSIKGACDTVFICDGKIDDINKPLSEINCKCPKSSINERLNDIPNCRIRNIYEANDILDDILIKPDRNLLLPNDAEFFDPNIYQNIGASHLINPCISCPVTGKRILNSAIATFGRNNKSCSLNFADHFKNNRNEYFGIPYRRSPDDRLLVGSIGPDAILGVYWNELLIYAGLEGVMQRFVFLFNSTSNSEFFDRLELDKSKRYAIAVDELLLGVNLPIPNVKKSGPESICSSFWPTYKCQWIPDAPNSNVTHFTSNITPIDTKSNTLSYTPYRDISGSFLWGKDNWYHMMDLNYWFVEKEVNIDTVIQKYVTNNENYFTNYFADRVKFMCWGFRANDTNGEWEVGFYTNGIDADWRRLKASLVSYN